MPSKNEPLILNLKNETLSAAKHAGVWELFAALSYNNVGAWVCRLRIPFLICSYKSEVLYFLVHQIVANIPESFFSRDTISFLIIVNCNFLIKCVICFHRKWRPKLQEGQSKRRIWLMSSLRPARMSRLFLIYFVFRWFIINPVLIHLKEY